MSRTTGEQIIVSAMEKSEDGRFIRVDEIDDALHSASNKWDLDAACDKWDLVVARANAFFQKRLGCQEKPSEILDTFLTPLGAFSWVIMIVLGIVLGFNSNWLSAEAVNQINVQRFARISGVNLCLLFVSLSGLGNIWWNSWRPAKSKTRGWFAALASVPAAFGVWISGTILHLIDRLVSWASRSDTDAGDLSGRLRVLKSLGHLASSTTAHFFRR